MVSIEEIVDNAIKLRECYDKNLAFPAWSLAWLGHNPNAKNILQRATILHHRSDDADVVRRLATYREPSNLKADKAYDKDALETFFGYREGLYDKMKKPPNIALACTTPICPQKALGKDTSLAPKGAYRYINVVSLIPFAFDSKKQPDYQRFVVGGKLDVKSLYDAYVKVWYLGLYACALWMKVEDNKERIFKYTDIGGSHFLPAEFMTQKSYKLLLLESLIDARKILAKKYPDVRMKIVRMGKIPETIFEEEEEVLQRTLYVNSWDPFSVVGNGNADDKSLDGVFGCHSALAVITFPFVNPYMLMNQVAV